MRKQSAQWFMVLCAGFFALTLAVTGCSNDKGSPLVNVTLLQTTDIHNAASGVGSFNAYTPMDTSDADTVPEDGRGLRQKSKRYERRKRRMATPYFLWTAATIPWAPFMTSSGTATRRHSVSLVR